MRVGSILITSWYLKADLLHIHDLGFSVRGFGGEGVGWLVSFLHWNERVEHESRGQEAEG